MALEPTGTGGPDRKAGLPTSNPPSPNPKTGVPTKRPPPPNPKTGGKPSGK